MKLGAFVTSAFLATLIVLAPITFSSSMAGSESLQRAPPLPPVSVFGYVYEPDGVTPVADCVVNVTNTNTGAWVLTTTDPDYGFYMVQDFVFGTIFVPGHVYNVTATKGSQIGWNEVQVGGSDEWLLWIDVVLSPPKVSFELNLIPGWNVVSLPLIGTGITAATLGLRYGDLVIGRFNTTTQVHDEVYAVGISPPFKDFPIRPGLGYYIRVHVAEVLNITGWVPTTRQSINIVVPPYGGWALLGFASLKPRHASEVPAMFTGGRADLVVGFTEASQLYHSYLPALPFTDFVIYPGDGFWVHMTGSATWAYDP